MTGTGHWGMERIPLVWIQGTGEDYEEGLGIILL